MPAGWCAGGRPAEQRWLHVSRCTAAGAGARRRSNHAPRQQQQQQKKKPQQQQQKKKRKVAANAAGLGVPQANVRRLPKFNRRAVKRLPLGGVAVHGLNGFRVEDKTPLLASERKALTVLSQRMPVYLGNHHTVFRNDRDPLTVVDRMEVAVLGVSNVGKSTLVNRLLNNVALADTSSRPGCTTQLNFYLFKGATPPLCLVDCPGFGYAKTSKVERHKWVDMMATYLQQRPPEVLRLCLFLVDSRRGVSEYDHEVLEMLDEYGVRFLPVLTKADKVPAQEETLTLMNRIDEFERYKHAAPVLVATSGDNGFGVAELREMMIRVAALDYYTPGTLRTLAEQASIAEFAARTRERS